MKIGLLSLPLQTNYGGLLQAYALQYTLRQMGHEVWFLNREKPKSPLFYALTRLERLKDRYLKGDISVDPLGYIPPLSKRKAYVGRHMRAFAQTHILPRKEPVESSRALRSLLDEGFDAFVVGSDQVWRPCYTARIANYFLDFTGDKEVRRIAYAASFGVDRWDFSPKETVRCAALAKKFDAVSVRESSGVSLATNYLGVEAEIMPDPTLLLDKSVYEALAAEISDENSKQEGGLLTYFLDITPQKSEVVQGLSDSLHLTPFSVMPAVRYSSHYKGDLEACSYPSVSAWLQGFRDAEFVVTDSYHGTIFALLFNKPFITIANPERGMARFDTLCTHFPIKSRIHTPTEHFEASWLEAPLDFDVIKTQREKLSEIGRSFLEKHLSPS